MALTKNVTIAILGNDKTRGAATSSVANLKKIGAAAAAMGIAMAAAAGAAAIALARNVKQTIDLADATAKLSQKIGVSVEDLSTLDLGLQLSGTSMQSFQTGVRTLSQRMLDASRGLKSSKDDFDDLGLSVTDANGDLRDNFDVLLDVADAFEDMEDGTQKAALAQKLLGRAGGELIPLLNQGAEGLRKMQQESRDLGVEISSGMAKEAEDFNDNLTRMKSRLFGVSVQIAENVLPGLNTLARALLNVSSDIQLAESTGKIFNLMLDGMALGVTAVSGEIHKVMKTVGAFTKAIDAGYSPLGIYVETMAALSDATTEADASLAGLIAQMALNRELNAEALKVELSIGGVVDGVGEAKAQLSDLAQTTQSSFRGAGSAILGAAINTRDIGQAAKGAGLAVVQAFGDMLLQKGLLAAFDTFNTGKAITEQAAIGTASAATGKLVSESWQPAALATSLASFGANSVPAISGILATAAALAGATAVSSGVSFAGQAHDGIVFPSSGSYLMNVEKGESIVPNLPPGDSGRGSSAPMAVNVMLGTRTLARGVVDAIKGGVLSLKINGSGHVVAA